MVRPKVNASVTVTRKSTDWQGAETTTTVGTYDVWLEERTIRGFPYIGVRDQTLSHGSSQIFGRGVIFFFDNVDVDDDCYVTVNGSTYKVVAVDTYTGRQRPGDTAGAFHHKEVVYK